MKAMFLLALLLPPAARAVVPRHPPPIVRASSPNDDYVFCHSQNVGKDQPNHFCFIGYVVGFFGPYWKAKLTFKEYLTETVGPVEYLGAAPVDKMTTVIFFRRTE